MNHDQGRAVDGDVDVRVLREEAIDQLLVRDVALVEFPPSANSRLPVTKLSRITGAIAVSEQTEAIVLPM
jgi:hypothetical protein